MEIEQIEEFDDHREGRADQAKWLQVGEEWALAIEEIKSYHNETFQKINYCRKHNNVKLLKSENILPIINERPESETEFLESVELLSKTSDILEGLLKDCNTLEAKIQAFGSKEFHKHYERLEFLGKGAYGQVFKARRKSNKQVVAIKELYLNDNEEIKATAKEVKLLKKFMIGHEECAMFFVCTFDYFVATDLKNGPIVIAMEYVEGQSIEDLSRNLPKEKRFHLVLQLLPQLIKAFNDLKHLGVVHRDIKPANMMVTPVGQLKIIDFGLSCETQAECEGYKGTERYMAPEVKLRLKSTHESDLWSLGISLIEILLGHQLTEKEYENFVIKRNYVGRFSDIIYRLLDPVPELRRL